MKIGKKVKIEKLIDPGYSRIINGSKDTYVSSISTDSRSLKKGDFFIPIIGPNFDGHDFILDAIKKGCSGFVFESSRGDDIKATLRDSNSQEIHSLVLIETGSTIDFLIQMAASYIRMFDCIKIGITGSAGKTTTKCFLASILSKKSLVYTPKNYNTEIGVPLSVMKVKEDTGIFMAELAMRGKDQIKILSEMLDLDIALITAIGPSHLEFFNNQKDIALAKSEIVSGLKAKGILFLNDSDKYSPFIQKHVDRIVKKFGSDKQSFVFFDEYEQDAMGRYRFDINSKESKITRLSIKVPGLHNVYNACGAAAIAYYIGVTEDQIKYGLETAMLEDNRMNIEKTDKMIILDDCYNANPLSVREAVNTVVAIRQKNKGWRTVAILGDMLELGPTEKELHFQVGRYLKEKKIDILVAFGKLSKSTCKGFMGEDNTGDCYYFEDKESMSDKLGNIIREKDIVLVKGSRSNKMETLLGRLRKS